MQEVSWLVFLEILPFFRGGFLQFFSHLSRLYSVSSPRHLSIYLHLNPHALAALFVLISQRKVCVIVDEEQNCDLSPAASSIGLREREKRAQERHEDEE